VLVVADDRADLGERLGGVPDEIHPVAGLQSEGHVILDDISDGALWIRDPPLALGGGMT
jgi:hypothetical protein